MNSQTRDNLADLEYTFGYFSGLLPAFLSFCALSRGVQFDANRNLRYLELGFGQGVSLNVHAAASSGEYWGNDISAAHDAHARKLAEVSGANVRVLLKSFEDLSARTDLPQFDLITLHGIWSWVSDQDRATILDLARRYLAPGGLLYVSYNCSSGWAAATSLRQLLLAHALQASPSEAPATEKIEHAMQFAQGLADAGAAYFKANPTVVAQFRSVKSRNRTYLAHEFLGPHWQPTTFFEIATLMEAAGLEFVASTFLLEHGDRFTLNDSARKLLVSIDQPVLREVAVECFINPQFRQDLFANQPTRLSPEERREAFRRQRFVLTTPVEAISLTIPGPREAIVLDPVFYRPVLEALAARDYVAKSLGDISSALKVSLDDLIDAFVILVGAGYVQPAIENVSDEAYEQSRKLNHYICNAAKESGDLTVLASPVLGAGVRIGRADLLFLLARSEGLASSEWADFAASCVSGDAPANPEVLRGRLQALAAEFETQTLPILIATGVA